MTDEKPRPPKGCARDLPRDARHDSAYLRGHGFAGDCTMSTITNEEIAALLDAHNGGSRDPWQHGQKMANALEKLAAEREWQPMSDPIRLENELAALRQQLTAERERAEKAEAALSRLGECDWRQVMPDGTTVRSFARAALAEQEQPE